MSHQSWKFWDHGVSLSVDTSTETQSSHIPWTPSVISPPLFRFASLGKQSLFLSACFVFVSLNTFPDLIFLGPVKQQTWLHTHPTGKTSNNNSSTAAAIWIQTSRINRLSVAFIWELISVSQGLGRKQTGLDNCRIILLSLQIWKRQQRFTSATGELKWLRFLFCVNSTDPMF